MTIDMGHWQERLDLLADKHGVVGAQLGISLGGEVQVAVTGQANRAEGIEATNDTLFQIGSITKVWTATMIMQLVEEGRVELDTPVVTYLPGLALVDPAVTVRHLLTHTSGIDGDHFFDTGSGADCLEKYAASLIDVAQNHPVGATMSYCNSGYSLLGRLLEVIDGKVFDQIVQDRLAGPLGLSRTWTLPEDVIRYRNALGHLKLSADTDIVGSPPDGLVGSPTWGIFRSAGPAGLVNAPVAELLAFARLHLDGGVAPSGDRLLTAASVAAMQVPQVVVPDRFTLGQHWGLGWILWEWDGRAVYGHDGATLGQNAYMKIVPDCDLAVALLTNGGGVSDLYYDLFTEILAELAGLDVPPRVRPTDFAGDVTPFLGVYERAGAHIEIAIGDDGPELRATNTGPLNEGDPTTVYPMRAHSENVFVIQPPGADYWLATTFYEVPDAGWYLHMGARATPKVS